MAVRGNSCFNVNTMKKTLENKKPKRIFGPDLLIAVTVLGAIFVLLYIWMTIQAALHYQSGMEYGFIVLYPVVLGASAILFLCGSVYLIRAIAWRTTKKQLRITAAIVGCLCLAPGAYLGGNFLSYFLVITNANHVISDQDALKLVQQCKVGEITRDVGDLTGESHTLTGKLYLKQSAQNAFEKQSYFYGFRSFNASYYDELFRITQSQEIRQKCGDINYKDDTRTSLPLTVKWATLDEAKQMLDSCSINEVFPNQRLENPLESQTSNPNSPTGIFMTLRPSPHGYFGRLYISSADQDIRNEILDFANKKKPVCVYHLPNIIDTAN